ncbi:Catalyzes the cleavage of p-aminobenzoyl-glutamate to p-aminobenzoate and glutamate, subunit A [plant metagenome]|uniref:Catalyzes the cleavage of p-aminobenzoyl-glutamate to p-aminobenzoate and glutamate, subunit A n=2 Tax=root TaxID=1 RepID=A0A1C3JX45_9BURK|nr:M20 aminoacylase family protein [Orrella dioscoreae]SBT23688.1 Catalyzes the cleavage of p-aminobenzoyl-glutamate to p-aminobenzoate and glutamate, subunit A [Orrella dioscoreae]SOE47652.1 Catalyzes the cleavage of p-aminobenzoyl-glutamate to p-aminobenzoate and glutamate, subunit A [Orrella dioscoreae]
MNLIEPIVAWQAEMTLLRRDIHAHPELGYEEHRTSELIATKLQEWGIPIVRGLGVTGVVGTIRGKAGNSTRAIGLRADMDALPMEEVNTFGHASTIPGRMHGCGHDGHTTMLLSAARHLAQYPDFDGTVHVIFQPAEEGGAGAQRMIDDGLFEQFPMEAVYGMHNWPGMPVGTFGLTPGPIMGSSNEFDITLTGKGAHAAMPNLGVDPVMAAVQIAQSLQTIISRNRNPMEAAVLSVTQIHTGSAYNVVPNDARLCGTVRTFTDETLDLIEQRMGEIVRHTAAALACQAEFSFKRNYPATVNDAKESAFCADVARELVGDANVNANVVPTMGAEDFAFMLRAVPGCYVWVGNGDGGHRESGHGLGPCMLHNGSYDFNDDILPLGASYWVNLARKRLAA